MKNLRQKENDLFKQWSQGKNRFAKDGTGSEFSKQKKKIIFIAKETNDTGEDFDLRDYLDNGMVFKSTLKKNGRTIHRKNSPMGYNLYRWATALLFCNLEKKEYLKRTKDIKKRENIFRKVAFMNIKKESGGSSSNTNQIIKAGEKDKKFLKSQLELYIDDNEAIKILFLCGDGVYTPIKKLLELMNIKRLDRLNLENNRFVEFYENNLLVIKFYHFSSRKTLDETFYMLNKVCKYISSKIPGYKNF